MTLGVVHDSSDEEQVKASQRIDDDRSKDLLFIISQPRGRRFIYEVIYDTCHISRSSIDPTSSDNTGFNEGARAVGEALLEAVKTASPKLFMKMLEENHFNG